MKNNRKETGLEVAVIGMTCRLPRAQCIDEFWNNLKNGTESITFFTDEDLKEAGVNPGLLADPNYVKARGEFQDKEYFDNSFFGYSPREAQSMDPQIRVFHECSWEALEKAGYDPTSYNGSIGVYAGASNNVSWQTLEMAKQWVEGEGGIGTSILNNGLLFLSQSVSHKLDLTGPSLTFFTACSTSLVAVHLACRALVTGECHMALAGGISITSTKKGGYFYREGMIFSPDGHCRTFDARAQGMLFGEGVGIVVLKRLKDAVADGDNIIAVIKGSSINNDGSDKASFTAPSQKRIAEVIKKALKISQVDPETITYVEAHGTGTPLGDPIEIGALTRAFNTGKKEFCRIGSAKTNIGHLDVAAGIAGFIKTVLALKHKLIPPSLHFETPNPKIDFENSPFKVNARLSQWDNINGHPLRGGVNSAGFGGTNAFVILEEAPGMKSSPQSRVRKIFLLSARTESALNKATENLAEYLKSKPGANLADVAYTLQVGRKAFQYRRMLLCQDINDAIDGLSTPGSREVKTFLSKVENRDIIFMFPGQGSQYVNMGLELYQKEPLFREEMDRCFEILNYHVENNIKEILYPQNLVSKVSGVSGENSSVTSVSPVAKNKSATRTPAASLDKIHQTEIAQPLIFTIEYALAKLLINWGIKPHALIGHSIGEYVAACLASVFSLEDALALVALRGKLMQQMPRGSMVSAALSLEKLEPLLNEKLSLAAVNGPLHCVVAGPIEAIEAFEKLLQEKEHKSTRLYTSHAFHSKMMDPIMAQFEDAVSKIKLNKPEIPFISNLTGNWLTAEEVTNPAYWANHLRKTVYFSDGLGELLKKDHPIFVEVGPGQVLSKLVKQHPEKSTGHLIINLLRHPKEDVSDDYFLLDKIGLLWLYGVSIDWSKFYRDEKRHRIPLPSYPFERNRFPFDGDPFNKILEVSTRQNLITKKSNISDWFYLPLWKQAAPVVPAIAKSSTPGEQSCWMVFSDTLGIGTAIADTLRKREQDVVLVKIGTGFNIEKDFTGTNTYTVNPTGKTDYEILFGEIRKINKMPQRIVHLWSLSQHHDVGDNRKDALTIERAAKCQDCGFYSLLYLLRGLQEENVMESIHLTVVTNNMQSVCGEEYLLPEQSTVLGPVNVIPQEKPTINCSSIDISLPFQGELQKQRVVEQLLVELLAESYERMVAIRDNRRWLPTYEPIRLPEPENEKAGLREEGVYLVTGGVGRIGLVLTEYLAKTVRAKLILTCHSAFPPNHEWDQWLTTHQQMDKVSQRIRKIQKIEKLGGKVWVVRADVSDEEQMRAAISQAEENFGPLNGVIHAAGVEGERYFSLFVSMEKSQCEAHFQPKMLGLIVLEKVLEGKKLDFLLIMSSLSSILGGLGFSAYSAANIFMDSFLQQHNRKNAVPWLSVNWDSWQLNGGNLEILSMDAEEGIEAFKRILSRMKEGRLIHSLENLQARIDRWIKLNDLKQEEESGEETLHTLYSRENLSSPYATPRNPIEKEILDIWQNIFGFGNLGIYDDFFELGGDSLNVMTLSSKIHKRLNVEVPLTEFFNSPTIEKLAQYISAARKHTFSAIEPVETKKYYPLSPAQKRLYILHQLEKDSTSYNETATVTLEGTFNKEKFERTFIRMINRHESLRTSFLMAADVPVQVIHDNVEFKIEYYHLTIKRRKKTQKGTKKVEDNIDQYHSQELRAKSCIKDFVRPFDLSKAPLLRVGLIETSIDKHILIYDMHHSITDGTSQTILTKEFMLLYEGEELAPLRLQYKDYSQWQQSREVQEALEQQEKYWLKEFEGEIPVLNMPYDYPRPAVQSFEGSPLVFTIGEKETMLLKQIALEKKTTLYMVLLSITNIFLSKISGQEDIVIGSPIAGRSHANLEKIIGMFANTLAFRNSLEGQKTFTGFLEEVKKRTLAGFGNQDYQFEDLVEKVAVNRDISRNPVFDVMFILQNIERTHVEIPGLKLLPHLYENRTVLFDLILEAKEVGEKIQFKFEYCIKLFKAETIERFINYFKKIIFAVIEKPGTKISQLEIISEKEKRFLLYEFNDTASEYPSHKTIHRLFEEQVEKASDKIAVVGPSLGTIHEPHLYEFPIQISYRKLHEKSNQLADMLKEKGAKPDTIVGLIVERSFEMIIGILGILKAGGANLPIDPTYPEERINYMLADSGAKVLLASPETRVKVEAEVEESFGQPRCLSLQFINIATGLESAQEPSPSTLTLSSTCQVSSTNLAYVIYTSGSTGNPKGVMIQHRSVVNVLLYLSKEYPVLARDTYLLKTSCAFDVSVSEIFGWFPGGGRLAVLEPGAEKDTERIMRMVHDQGITHINFVPSMFNVFVDFLNSQNIHWLSSLKYIFLAGEALSPQVINKFRKLESNHQLENIYGPTETTIYASKYSLSQWDGGDRIPIGKPLQNVKLYILSKYNNLQPMGVVGELCISGIDLARGYLNHPELTAERFIRTVNSHSSLVIGSSSKTNDRSYKFSPNDQCPMTSDRFYKTGDLARWLPDGNIEFFGRTDTQVKIRGYRIELGEIETLLLKHESIKEAVVINKEKENGETYLCAYIVSQQNFVPGQAKNFLAAILPNYMIPSYFVTLNHIPLTPSGKVDRKALPPVDPAAANGYAAPTDSLEKRLVEIWSDVLGIDKSKISTNANFFELGGHSLKATILTSRIHKSLQVKIPLTEIFKHQTIRGLSGYIKGTVKEKYADIESVEKKEYYPLSSAQLRLYFLQHMNLQSTAYNIPRWIPLHPAQPLEKLEQTFIRLIHRHESLRTSFHIVNNEPVQRIHDTVDFKIEKCLPQTKATFIGPFDLSQAPLFRAGVEKLQKGNQVLHINMHHIIVDNFSNEILLRDFEDLFEGKELAPLRIQYKGFAQWQNKTKQKDELKQQELYWLKEFEKEIPVLRLATDYERPEEIGPSGKFVDVVIEKDELEVLRSYEKDEMVTIFMTLLAIFNVLLFKITGQEDIVIGTLAAGRGHQDLESIIGMFVNTVAVRNFPRSDMTFKEFLRHTKTRTLQALSNQDYQFEDLVEKVVVKREKARNPIFDVSYNFFSRRDDPEAIDLGRIDERKDWVNLQAKFDMGLLAIEKKDLIICAFGYRSNLFKRETIERFSRYLKEIISAVVKNEDILLGDITFSSDLGEAKSDFIQEDEMGFGF